MSADPADVMLKLDAKAQELGGLADALTDVLSLVRKGAAIPGPRFDDQRTEAIVGVFGYAAELTPREDRSYGAWVHETTERFKRSWAALETEADDG